LTAGLVNIWGDWAVHLTMTTAFAYRFIWPVTSPLLVDQSFGYPFVSAFISGMLIRGGVPLIYSLTIPSYLGSVALVIALLSFYRLLFKSWKVAIIASLLFLLNGGIGFFFFAQDILSSPQPLTVLINPPHEYTRLDSQNLKWISVIDSMMIPQRAFVIGFPIALFGLTLILKYLVTERDQHINSPYKWPWLFGAGLLFGVLPIIHTHSFLASGIILAHWAIAVGLITFLPFKITLSEKYLLPRLSKAGEWLYVASVAGLVSVPLYWFFFAHQTDNHFMKWFPGWYAREFKISWWWFWFSNWGVLPLLAAGGWLISFLRDRGQKIQSNIPWLTLPFWTLFLLINLILFQPFVWDNTKLLVWSSVGLSGLAGYLLVYLWQYQPPKRNRSRFEQLVRKILLRSIVVIFFLFSIASGTIDAYRVLRVDLHSYDMFSTEELTLAEWVKENTPVNARWLTSDQHNHWLYNLTGRQPIMAYRGWLWTHGYDYLTIERDVRAMFLNPSRTLPLFEKYKVEYIVIGPSEKAEYSAFKPFFDESFTSIHQSQNYTLYKVKK
jgi:hypothetical protein